MYMYIYSRDFIVQCYLYFLFNNFQYMSLYTKGGIKDLKYSSLCESSFHFTLITSPGLEQDPIQSFLLH